MSDHVPRPPADEEATSGPSVPSHKLGWMSHWMNISSKPPSVPNHSSLVSYQGQAEPKKGLALGKYIMEDLSKASKGAGINSDEIPSRMIGETKKNMGTLKKIRSSPAPTLCLYPDLHPDTENPSTLRTQNEYESGHKNVSLALARDDTVRNPDLIRENNLNFSEKHVLCNSFQEQKDNVASSFGEFGRHFSNDNFTCLDQGQCKFKKFSTILFHEDKMNNNHSDNPSTSKNFLPLILKKQPKSIPNHYDTGIFPCQRNLRDIDQQKLCNGCLSLDRVPCSVRNVETMRICTMVDSVENSAGGTPMISQRAHHFLFTKETCVNLSKDCQTCREPEFDGSCHPQGVRIEPLWTTDDSAEVEITDNPLTGKTNSRNDSSVQADTMQIDDLKSQLIPSVGMASSPLKKDDSTDENVIQPTFSFSTEKSRSKRPIAEIPDINEEFLSLQPAGSSTDSKEPSTSRVHSLNAKHLFPCNDQTSRSEFNVHQNPGSRWIKRLKVSDADSFGVGTKSSEIGEASSHKKFNVFFNKIMKPKIETLNPMLKKDSGDENMSLGQNIDSLKTSGCPSSSSEKGDQRSLMGGCPWIQRWRQNPSTTSNPEPLVICEPHDLKVGLDEVGRKQFPSIAAMALMGKTMNGFRSCEFKKRGSVVVWNTKEY